MLSVSEALRHIQHVAVSPETQTMLLKHALGFVVAEDIRAPINFPDVRQSAVDGYGFTIPLPRTHQQAHTFTLQDIIQAGSTQDVILKPQHSVRIFTGAKVPDAVNCIVMQEYVVKENDERITIPQEYLIELANIRPIASQCKQGDVLLRKGVMLTPGAMALLASVGIHEMNVFKKPRVGIMATGKELIALGNAILPGQVYESNTLSLSAALQQIHIPFTLFSTVDDNLESLSQQINVALQQCDVLLITGGVSVGDYDFVLEACTKNKVEQVFHKVKQRPGKPLYFGKKDSQFVFGLPGNPASVLSCFYMFVYPMLMRMSGNTATGLTALQLPLVEAVKKKAGLTFFLRGKLSEHGVQIPSGQESYKMTAFAEADCIISLEENREAYQAGEFVKVYLLPS